MSDPVNVEKLLTLVQATCEIGTSVSMGRIVGRWLEIFEAGDEVCYAYWVRENSDFAKGYQIVELDLTAPDPFDLELEANFPQG